MYLLLSLFINRLWEISGRVQIAKLRTALQNWKRIKAANRGRSKFELYIYHNFLFGNSTRSLFFSICWWTVDHRTVILFLFNTEVVFFHSWGKTGTCRNSNGAQANLNWNLQVALSKLSINIGTLRSNIAEFPSKEHPV